MPTNQGGNDFVSGDTFWDPTYQAMDSFGTATQYQADPTLLATDAAPLQDLDGFASNVDLDSFFLPTGSANMMTSTSPQETISTNFSPSQAFTESPDILQFADPALAALFEDTAFNKLSFPSPPDTTSTSQTRSLETYEQDWTTEAAPMAAKRTRDQAKPDARSACWQSPICPRNTKEGTPPNPSTCDGACAPFLFSDELDFKLPDELFPSTEQQTVSDTPKSLTPERLVMSRKSSTADKTPEDMAEERRVKEESDVSPPAVYPTSRASRGRGRMPHNQVERKYRESLNTQLEALRRVVPALQQNSSTDPCGTGDRADIEDLPNPALNKPSKAIILSSATSYIKSLEREQARQRKESERLAERVKVLEKIVRCEDCEVLGWFRGMKLEGKNGRNVGKVS